MFIDEDVNFELHIDSVFGKVNPALNKICILIRGSSSSSSVIIDRIEYYK